MAFDPQRFAMDYHIIGFRECASEVARYLVTIEGMDIQDPLRLRLMSHLQCFVAQRELSKSSAAATMSSSNWNSYQPNYPPPTQGYQTYPATPVTPTSHHQSGSSSQHHSSFNSSSSYMPSSSYLGSSHSILPQSPEYSSSSGYASTSNNSSSSANVNTSSSSASNNNNASTSPVPQHAVSSSSSDPAAQQSQDNQQQPIYTDLSNSNDRLQLSLNGNYHYGNANQLYANTGNNGYNNNNNSKPYRPWHPEMAY